MRLCLPQGNEWSTAQLASCVRPLKRWSNVRVNVWGSRVLGPLFAMLRPASSKVHMSSAVSAEFCTKPWHPVLDSLECTFVQAPATGAALADEKTHAVRAHVTLCPCRAVLCALERVLLPARHTPTPGTLADCLATLLEAIEQEGEAHVSAPAL